MKNENPPKQLTDMDKKALLTEYQVCQHDNSSTALNYWTLAGIFIGISSVLLGGLIYGVLSNKDLFEILLNNTTSELQPEKLTLGIMTSVLGTAVIIILYFLWGWLKRVSFLGQCNFERMRDIELMLGMRKSWRVHTLDQWHKIRDKVGTESDKEIWDKIRIELGGNLSPEDCERLEDMKDELAKLIKRYHLHKGGKKSKNPEYERPSSKWHYKGIFLTIISMWVLLLIGGLALLYDYSYIAMWAALGGVVLICAIILLCKRFAK